MESWTKATVLWKAEEDYVKMRKMDTLFAPSKIPHSKLYYGAKLVHIIQFQIHVPM